MDEMQRREKILGLLYSRRFSHPQQPSLNLRELEALLNTPKGDLEFSLWYLKESGYLIRTDSAHHTITLKGVQFAEALKTGDAKWIERREQLKLRNAPPFKKTFDRLVSESPQKPRRAW